MRTSRAPALFASLLVLGGGLLAFARMGPSDTRLLPYQGRLQTSSVDADGDYDFRFGLFVSESADASCVLTNPTACTVWGEEQLAVPVSAGRFGVKLGESTALTDADLAYNTLWLAMAVKGENDGAFSLLSAKQEILPTPWAARAAAANDYKVTGELTVGQGADVTGGLVVSQGAEVTGGLVVDGLWSDTTYVGEVGFGVNYAGFAHEDVANTSSYGFLHRNDGLATLMNAGAGGSLYFRTANADRMTLDSSSHLRVNGNVTIGGQLDVNGGLGCERHGANFRESSAGQSPPFTYPAAAKAAELFQYGWICWDREGDNPNLSPLTVNTHNGYYAAWHADAEVCGRINWMDSRAGNQSILVHPEGSYYFGLRYLDVPGNWHGAWANGGGQGQGPSGGFDHWSVWICR
jgi:hypothetical protein